MDNNAIESQYSDDNHQDSLNEQAFFTPSEARVFACLIEKNLATPANYPLTINSLMLACNQKTNRDPVMNLSDGEVAHTARALAERDLAEIDYGDRANKVRHKALKALALKREQQAILCMLMLRGPMTLNDIRARTERMVDFADNAGVAATVSELIEHERALVVMLPKGNGWREDRYAHTLCGAVEVNSAQRNPDSATATPPWVTGDYQAQIDALEQRVARLEAALGVDT